MSTKNRRRKPGTLKRQFQRLYADLVQQGILHEDIQALTLREALLLRYGAPAAVDAALGIGVYSDIRKDVSPVAHWRKSWDLVQEAEARLQPLRVALLEALRPAVEDCLDHGLPAQEITAKVQRIISTRAMHRAS